VLLTTIPKCGKNVLVSFLSALRLDRRPGGDDVFDAATHAQARWYHQGHQGDPGGILTRTAPAFERVVDGFAAMPDNAYLHGHFGFDAELHQRAREAGVSIVFVYRDPRACLASLAHFLIDRNEPAEVAARLPGRDLGTVLRFLVNGDNRVPPFEDFYAPYEGWKAAEGVTVVRFEDIIGPRGGGSAGLQFAVLSALASRIGWQGGHERLTAAISGAFNPGAGTFRRGTIHGWRDDLGALWGTAYWERVRALAGRWGYVDDLEPVPPVADDLVDATGYRDGLVESRLRP
jgi:hypothetical protein